MRYEYREINRYNSEMQRIAGRFHLVDETPEAKIVGLLGNCYWHDLTADQKEHIAGFYMLPGHECVYLDDYPVPINRSMFHGFIKILKEPPARDRVE